VISFVTINRLVNLIGTTESEEIAAKSVKIAKIFLPTKTGRIDDKIMEHL
jgi:hypothetical protein